MRSTLFPSRSGVSCDPPFQGPHFFPHTMTSLHQALRAATRSDHDRTEALPLFELVLGGQIGRTAYQAYLQVLRAWLRSLPTPLASWPAPLKAQWEFSVPVRLGWLDADLRGLGVDPASDCSGGTNLQPMAMAMAMAEAVWGMLYVVEGSALGGRVLARRIMDSQLPIRYLEGHREQTGAYWGSFLNRLEHGVDASKPELLQECLMGARQAFAALAQDVRAHQRDWHERT